MQTTNEAKMSSYSNKGVSKENMKLKVNNLKLKILIGHKLPETTRYELSFRINRWKTNENRSNAS